MLSISQLCDKSYKIVFYHAYCMTLENDIVSHVGNKKGNVYKIKIDACMRIERSYLIVSINESSTYCV